MQIENVMTRHNTPRVSFIGFGEAGQAIAAGLRESGIERIAAWDILFPEPSGARLKAAGEAIGVRLANSAADAVAETDMIISAVTAASSLEAARSVEPHLTAKPYYLDINSVSPGRLLAAGRDRIDVEIIGFSREMRLDRAGGLQTGGGRHRRNDHVGLGDRVGRRIRQPHADRLAGRFQPHTFDLRKQNVPGGDALDAALAQAGGDRLSGLAETDKRNARCVAAGHDLLNLHLRMILSENRFPLFGIMRHPKSFSPARPAAWSES